MANDIQQHVFFFTYDLQIGFYKKLQVINTTKIYDFEKKKFYDYGKSDNPFQTSFHPRQEQVQNILNVLTNKDYAIILKDNDMIWYKQVVDLYTKDSDLIISQKEILYNFLILKCKLCGFSEEFSISFIRHLFYLKKSENIDLKITINRLDNIINIKKIWVPYIIHNDCQKEREFLTKVVEKKQKEGFNFNFTASFGKEYLGICNNSFIMHTYLYNKQSNFFNKEGLSLENQMNILLKIYENYTENNLLVIFDYEPKWQRLKNDKNYQNRLISVLKDTLKLSMKAWN